MQDRPTRSVHCRANAHRSVRGPRAYHTKSSIDSWVPTTTGVVAMEEGKRQLPPPIFWVFVKKIGPKTQNLGLKPTPPVLEKFMGKIKTLSIIISSVRNLQLSVGIPSDICSMHSKNATSCLAYFLIHDAAACNHDRQVC